MKITRRRFLATSATAPMLAHMAHADDEAVKGWPIGMMIWRIGDILKFNEQVAWIKEAGLDAVGFHASAGHPPNWLGIEPSDANDEERARIRKMLAGFAAREIHAPFDCEISAETDPAILDKLDEVLQFASDVGVEVVTVHAKPPAFDAAPAPKGWLDTLDRLDASAANARVRVGIEFMTGFEWLEKAPHEWVGATLDVGHMYLNDGAGYRPYGSVGNLIRSLDAELFHVHIHDYDGTVDHIEIGTGHIDFPDVFNGLADVKYSGFLDLELNPDRVEPEGIKRSAAALREFAKAALKA